MPVYNEEEAIAGVVKEWVLELDKYGFNYTFCILNDGSKDNTLNILEQLKQNYSCLQIVNKRNSGHGQTCIDGYKLAIENDAEWIFQIDSDGQCDPRFFNQFVEKAEKHKAIYGLRKTRDDGMRRVIVSKFVVLFVFASTGIWVKDSNVPYRLIHSTVLKQFVSQVPKDFHLANIFVSVLTKKSTPIKWINIHFKDRSGGTASVKTFSFVKHGFKLFKQLKAATSTQ